MRFRGGSWLQSMGVASKNHPTGLISLSISFTHTHTHTHTHRSPVVRQKETLITSAHKGRYSMSDSSLSTAALQSTANFKHHITALKQKDFFHKLRMVVEINLSDYIM